MHLLIFVCRITPFRLLNDDEYGKEPRVSWDKLMSLSKHSSPIVWQGICWHRVGAGCQAFVTRVFFPTATHRLVFQCIMHGQASVFRDAPKRPNELVSGDMHVKQSCEEWRFSYNIHHWFFGLNPPYLLQAKNTPDTDRFASTVVGTSGGAFSRQTPQINWFWCRTTFSGICQQTSNQLTKYSSTNWALQLNFKSWWM